MKRLWCALILVIIAGGISTFEYISVKNSYNDFVDLIDETRTAVESRDYNKAKELSKELKADWDKKERTLNYVLEHTTLDEMSNEIAQLPDYTDDNSRDEFLSVTDSIKRQFTSLYASELPYGENIF
jgi:hypothetical protein